MPPPNISWPPPGYNSTTGYQDDVDVVYASIVNSIVDYVSGVVSGQVSAYSCYVSGQVAASQPVLNLYQWLASLVGSAGAAGTNGADGQGVVVLNYGQGAGNVPAGTPAGSLVLIRPSN